MAATAADWGEPMSGGGSSILPVEIVLHPSWWHHHEGITFDEDFFFHPKKRVEVEQRMERALFARWGRYGLGAEHPEERPLVGAVHLAAGFLVSEMLGCRVEYFADRPPEVHCAARESLDLDVDGAFASPAFRRFSALADALRGRYGRLAGDANWSGILNIALDLRGQDLFLDFADRGEEVGRFFGGISTVLDRFTGGIQRETGSSSISVNRTVRHVDRGVFLHSECSNTMISTADYERHLLPFDVAWSVSRRPFGIHYCGGDPHRYAASFQKIPHLDFLDVGWGGQVDVLRAALPGTFLNLRLSPVEILRQTPDEIRAAVRRLVAASGDLRRTGLCCINVDHTVRDEQVAAIFQAAESLREERRAEPDRP
jgi:hypothetical protein